MNEKTTQEILQRFQNKETNAIIRTKVINEEPWFVAKDVAFALDITWSSHTLDRIPEEWQGVVKLTTPCGDYQGGGLQQLKVINEYAMYKLAFRSNKPEADRFVNWIAGEVLPSIRRTGAYQVNGEQSQRPRLPLPKFRPFFEEWKSKVKPYLSRLEIRTTANDLDVTESHVRKVYSGNSMSRRVAVYLTDLAKTNRKENITYPEPQPVYQQLSINWE